MQTFKAELRTILFALRGSVWATHPEVHEVIQEYRHFEGAGRTPTQHRRVSLQIFHASRAIDSLLKHVVEHEATKAGRPVTQYLTLKRSLNRIQGHGVGGHRFSVPTEASIKGLINDRNSYMHRANVFPNDPQVRAFLNHTIRAINEAITFPP
jgi:hypothetical protein